MRGLTNAKVESSDSEAIGELVSAWRGGRQRSFEESSQHLEDRYQELESGGATEVEARRGVDFRFSSLSPGGSWP